MIAGGGPELNSYIKHSNSIGVQNIHLVGPVDDLSKACLLKLCSALVLPSNLRSEAFGLVLLEAAMQCKPLISTELNTGTSYVNENGKKGLVVLPNDVMALRHAINFMLHQPDIAWRMGQIAKSRFVNLFTSEKMCNGYRDIYKDAYKDFHGQI